MNQTSIPPQDSSFTKLSEAYIALHRQGDAPGIEAIIATYPELENEIRRRLPTLLLLEQTLGDQNRYAEIDRSEPVAGCHIGDEIGRGAYGIVYRAFQTELDREVAVKAIRLRVNKENQAHRFKIERQAMARLEHPNIVPIYAFTQVDMQAFLIMKLIEGYSFDRLLSGDCGYQGALALSNLRRDWTSFAQMASSITSGLDHAHQRGLIHRDIKPSNLMLDERGHVWITDFGLVKIQDQTRTAVSMTGDVIGTPRYMSPEQMRGVCDHRSDVYSLGLTLYEIATGSPGRHLESGGDATAEKIQSLREDNPDIPQELADVILKACEYSPDDRYQSAAELETVLQRFIKGQVPDRRSGRRMPDEEYRKKHFKRKLTVGFVAILLSSITTYAMLHRSAPNDTPAATEEIVTTPEAGALVNEIDRLIGGIETGRISDETIVNVAKKYRDSNLSTSNRVMRISIIINQSGLPEVDKTNAYATLGKLARLVIAEKVPHQWAAKMTERLVGDALSFEELKQIRMSDARIADWIQYVDNKIAPYGLNETDDVNLMEEVKDVFSGLSIEAPPARERPNRANQTARPTNQQRRQSLKNIDINRQKAESMIRRLPPELRQKALRELKKTK